MTPHTQVQHEGRMNRPYLIGVMKEFRTFYSSKAAITNHMVSMESLDTLGRFAFLPVDMDWWTCAQGDTNDYGIYDDIK